MGQVAHAVHTDVDLDAGRIAGLLQFRVDKPGVSDKLLEFIELFAAGPADPHMTADDLPHRHRRIPGPEQIRRWFRFALSQDVGSALDVCREVVPFEAPVHIDQVPTLDYALQAIAGKGIVSRGTRFHEPQTREPGPAQAHGLAVFLQPAGHVVVGGLAGYDHLVGKGAFQAPARDVAHL